MQKTKIFLFLSLQYLLPHHTLSRLLGKIASSKNRMLKNALIKRALAYYQIDLSPSLQKDPYAYESFNAFFTRELERPVTEMFPELPRVGSPAEGIVSQSGAMNKGQLIQAKGKTYSLSALFAHHPWAQAMKHGTFATIYLAPHNYHRVHAPLSGKLIDVTYIPGKLFSVNLTTANHIDQLFARNERLIFSIQTDHGKYALIMVGALLVAGMHTPFASFTQHRQKKVQTHSFSTPPSIEVGDELGYFFFGSTVIVVTEFPPHLLELLLSDCCFRAAFC